jgi:hypothetical protein
MIGTILFAIMISSLIGGIDLELSSKKVVCYYETPVQGYAAFWMIIASGITLINPIVNLVVLISCLFLLRYALYNDK